MAESVLEGGGVGAVVDGQVDVDSGDAQCGDDGAFGALRVELLQVVKVRPAVFRRPVQPRIEDREAYYRRVVLSGRLKNAVSYRWAVYLVAVLVGLCDACLARVVPCGCGHGVEQKSH